MGLYSLEYFCLFLVFSKDNYIVFIAEIIRLLSLQHIFIHLIKGHLI